MKHHTGPEGPHQLGQLQWGRGLGAAECIRPAAEGEALKVTSMGPRLRSRGMSVSPVNTRAQITLQWGRGLGAAE